VSIYRRPDSPFWWLCLERPRQRPLRESTAIPADGGTPAQTKRNRELAQQAYSVRMAELATGRYALNTNRPTITFGAFRAWYQEHFTSTKRSALSERYMLGRLGQFFDAAHLSAIAQAHVIEWRTLRAKQASPATVNRELALLRHVFNQAIPKYLDANPTKGVMPLRVPEEDIRLLTPDEEARLLAVCNLEDRALIICALDTLQRLSNVAGLKRAQDHGDYLTVLNPKVKGYKVPVSARLRQALDAIPVNGPYYFQSVQSTSVPHRQAKVARRFDALLQAAELPTNRKAGGLSFHSLRHTGASRMLARGVDIKTVQQLGGWQSLAVLQKYLHPTDTQKQEAVEVVSREPDVNRTAPAHSRRVPRQRARPQNSGRFRVDSGTSAD
jgi:integrase